MQKTVRGRLKERKVFHLVNQQHFPSCLGIKAQCHIFIYHQVPINYKSFV